MSRRLAKKVLLIGWDAADWQIIHPLVDRGKMPTLARFIDAGVIGNLASIQPMLSPMLWNSIATGKRPHRHGICGFIEPQPDGSGVRPVTSTSRQTKALWNILNQAGLKAHVIGWFASHPAEPINGVCVSDRFRDLDSNTIGSVHPARLEKKFVEMRMRPDQFDGLDLQSFIPRAAEIDQSDPIARKPLAILAKLLAECVTIHRTATWALENEPWDFAAVYYDAIDHFSHAFMPFHPPRLSCIDPALFELFKDVIEGIYRFHDMMLERLLQLAGDDTTVMIASDHGFYSNHLRPGANETTTPRIPNPVAWHRPHGILAIRGPEIRADERVSGASILDIAPTVLTLFGLAVGDDMDGRPLIEAFRRRPKIDRIASWDEVDGNSGMHPPHTRVDPMAEREAMMQMAALGYINPPSEDERANAQSAADDLRFNRAQSLLHGGALKQSIELLEPLAERYPADGRFLLALAQAFLQSGRLPEARKCIEQSAPNEQKNSPQRDLLFGILLLAEGRTEEALAILQRAEATEPRLPRLHNQLGAVYLRARCWEEAERAFRRALEIDGDSAAAWCGLATALLRRDQPAEAAESALRALGLQHFFPAAHFQLGIALARLGWPGRAAQAFEIGLTMRPGARWARRYQLRLRRQLTRSVRPKKSSTTKRAPAALISI